MDSNLKIYLETIPFNNCYQCHRIYNDSDFDSGIDVSPI